MKSQRTITKLPLKGGGWYTLDWPELALTTAKILEFIPKQPPFKGIGVLGSYVNSEDYYPKLDWALDTLKQICEHLENYARTGTVNVRERDGQGLVSAMAGIDVICRNRWGMPSLHRDIPIEIAAIARSVSLANSKSAKKKRGQRPNFLRDEKLRVQKSDPDLYWHEILDQLQGDGVVISHDDSVIKWKDEDGKTKTVKVSTFQKY